MRGWGGSDCPDRTDIAEAARGTGSDAWDIALVPRGTGSLMRIELNWSRAVLGSNDGNGGTSS